jgi:hypothetical protein
MQEHMFGTLAPQMEGEEARNNTLRVNALE